ncbi:MAG: PAS domain-containing protein [Myxococcaceae bacterium]|nr:PAS domain-containing protein [Myxococcaceae bacterium]
MGAVWSGAEVPEDLMVEILDQLAHPIFVKDRQFRFVVLNQAMCLMVGREREAMLGKTDFDFFPKEQAEFFRQVDEQMFSTGQTVHVPEEPLTDARGLQHVLATTKSPLRGESGTVTHVVGVIQDITWLKLSQDALQIANEQLEQRVALSQQELEAARDELLRKERLAVLGRLAGGLAHQIRNPLGAVVNAAALLKRHLSGPQPDPVTQALKMLEEEAWNANRIISDLVDYARVRKAAPAEASLPTLVEQVLMSSPPPRGVTVEKRVAALKVKVDELQTLSALGNLVRNACEAMSGGGVLTLEGREDGPYVVLAIEDSGPGFSREIESRLFEPLVTTKPLGLGLGLTTARLLLEGQGGRLSIVRARPGARVEVRLPKA